MYEKQGGLLNAEVSYFYLFKYFKIADSANLYLANSVYLEST